MTLAALLILIFLLPIFIFSLAYYNSESVQLTTSITHKTVMGMIFLTSIYGITLLVMYYWLNLVIDFPLVLRLISKPSVEDLSKIQNNEIYELIFYIVILYIFTYIAGSGLRYVIKTWEWDRFFLFRVDDRWHYLFKGYDWADGRPDGVMIAATVEIGKECYLYIGNLITYHFTKEGNLDRLILDAVSRRLLVNDKGVIADDKRFYPIDGDSFILKYDQVSNLNITYIKADEKDNRISVENVIRS